MATKKKSSKRGSGTKSRKSSKSDNGGDRGRDRDSRDDRGSRDNRGGSNRGGKREYFRLTGLWESKRKRGMFTGNLGEKQIEQLRDLCDQCEKGTGKMVIFMFENDGRDYKGKGRPPTFTIYADEGQEQERGGGGNGGGRSYGRGRDRDDDRGGDRDRNERRGSNRDDIRDDDNGKRDDDDRF